MAKMEAVRAHVRLLQRFRREVTVAWASMIAMEVREIVRFGVYFEGGGGQHNFLMGWNEV